MPRAAASRTAPYFPASNTVTLLLNNQSTQAPVHAIADGHMGALAREPCQLRVQAVKEVAGHQLAIRALRRANPRLTRLRMTISEQPSDRAISP